MKGTLFLVVGPSGAGKDTLLDGARQAIAGDDTYVFARRTITRPEDAGGEAHEAVDVSEFEHRIEAGGFLAHWGAHGLRYGIPASVLKELAKGRHVLANISRGAIEQFTEQYSKLVVLEVTAPRDILAARLAARGRESDGDIQRRLDRKAAPFPADVEVLAVQNDASPEEGIEPVSYTHLTLPTICSV